jgi:hypothetical protein
MLVEGEPNVESQKVAGEVDIHPEASTLCLGNKDTEGLDALMTFMENAYCSLCKQVQTDANRKC